MGKYLCSWQCSWITRNKSSTSTIRAKHVWYSNTYSSTTVFNSFQAADWAVIFNTIPKKHTISWGQIFSSTSTTGKKKKKAHGNYFSCTKKKKPVFGKTVWVIVFAAPPCIHKLTFVHTNNSYVGCKQMGFSFSWVQLEKSAESSTLKKA